MTALTTPARPAPPLASSPPASIGGSLNRMATVVTPESVCVPSTDIVARVIEDEIIIVPLVAGIGDSDDELYTLNETGRAVWQELDGTRTLGEVVAALAARFDAPLAQVEADVLGFAVEMVRRRISRSPARSR